MKRRIATNCCLLALSVGLALAQTSTGGISGTVKDSSGAGVPQAKLTLTNLDTNGRRSKRATSAGFQLHGSPRRATVWRRSGPAKKFIEEPIEVRVQLFVAVQAVLEIGSTSETVEVKGTVALIDLNTSSLGQIVENRQITQLPVNGRNTLAS
jgi:hypothetical protein